MDVQSHKIFFLSKASLWIMIHIVYCVSISLFSNDAVTDTCKLCIRLLQVPVSVPMVQKVSIPDSSFHLGFLLIFGCLGHFFHILLA